MLLEAAAALTSTPNNNSNNNNNSSNNNNNNNSNNNSNSNTDDPTTTTDNSNNNSSTERTVALELLAGAFETIRGVHDASWNELGYWFQTPEAWEASGNYRSLGYMRPLSIWGLQWALEQEPELLREAAAAGVADTEHE
jgi:hypothetical protein